MRLEKVFDDAPHRADIALAPGRIDPDDVTALSEALGLIDSAGEVNQTPERRSGAPAVSLKSLRKLLEHKSGTCLHPPRQREVMKGDNRSKPVFAAASQDASVMVQGGDREFSVLGLDAGPLDAETKGVESEAGSQCDVLGVSVVEVASIAGRLDAGRPLLVFPGPPVAVDVTALDLVRRLGRPDQKRFRQRGHR